MCCLHCLCSSNKVFRPDGVSPALVLNMVTCLAQRVRPVALSLFCVAALVISSFICGCSDQLITLIRMKTKCFVVWCIWVPEKKNHVCLFLLYHVTRARQALKPMLALVPSSHLSLLEVCDITKETRAQRLPRLSKQQTLSADFCQTIDFSKIS